MSAPALEEVKQAGYTGGEEDQTAPKTPSPPPEHCGSVTVTQDKMKNTCKMKN